MAGLTQYNTDNHCFELFVFGERAYIECKKQADVVYMIHTIVPESLRGNKIGEVLVEEALIICKEKGWNVVPLCPFALAYLKEHEEYQVLLRNQDREKYFG